MGRRRASRTQCRALVTIRCSSVGYGSRSRRHVEVRDAAPVARDPIGAVACTCACRPSAHGKEATSSHEALAMISPRGRPRRITVAINHIVCTQNNCAILSWLDAERLLAARRAKAQPWRSRGVIDSHATSSTHPLKRQLAIFCDVASHKIRRGAADIPLQDTGWSGRHPQGRETGRMRWQIPFAVGAHIGFSLARRVAAVTLSWRPAAPSPIL
jgi:hypothetical protein